MNLWNFEQLHETPSQTGGPYVHIGLLPKQANIDVFENNFGNRLITDETQGQRIRLEGQVFDALDIPLVSFPAAPICGSEKWMRIFPAGDVQEPILIVVFGISRRSNQGECQVARARRRRLILHWSFSPVALTSV
jgi:hypothetical protein